MGITRRLTRRVNIGDLLLGDNAPVLIQSMTNTNTADYTSTRNQIQKLMAAGCHLVRLAVPGMDSVETFGRLARDLKLPLVADIHFDFRLALAVLDQGAAKVRINPGNIGGQERLLKVINRAGELGAAVRLGVNSGSLPADILTKHQGPSADALVESALRYAEIIQDAGFDNLVVSLKSSDVLRTIEAYRRFSSLSNLPLHLGVTEAGTKGLGTIRSAVGIGTLLAEGIGDTIRVSLTADPVEEIPVAREILSCLGMLNSNLRLISCPTCSRTSADLIAITAMVEQELADLVACPIHVAIMGCPVNGPGEAREADIGIALAGGKAVFFQNGLPERTMQVDDAVRELLRRARELCAVRSDHGGGGS